MRYFALGAICLALTACAKTTPEYTRAVSEKLNVFDVAEDKASPATGPQIAYTYSLTYTLDAAHIAAVQSRQITLCKSQGPQRCQIVKTQLDNNGVRGDDVSGAASLLVDARIAVEFGKRLDGVVTAAGGTVSGRTTGAEDVTKRVIDTDARVRAKQALADRLFTLIHTADGKVDDLVAAEKAYADTQEELDAARSLQASLRQRVAMSEISISYTSSASTDLFAPLRRSAAAAGDSFGGSLGVLFTFVVVAAPWVALFALFLWVRRRFGWRWPFRRRDKVDPSA